MTIGYKVFIFSEKLNFSSIINRVCSFFKCGWKKVVTKKSFQSCVEFYWRKLWIQHTQEKLSQSLELWIQLLVFRKVRRRPCEFSIEKYIYFLKKAKTLSHFEIALPTWPKCLLLIYIFLKLWTSLISNMHSDFSYLSSIKSYSPPK